MNESFQFFLWEYYTVSLGEQLVETETLEQMFCYSELLQTSCMQRELLVVVELSAKYC